MPLSHLSLIDITEEKLRQVLDSVVGEPMRLECKRELPREPGNEKFLAAVTAFANAAGGDILYGVEEDREAGTFTIVGLDGSPDEERLRLLNIIGSSVEPRLHGVDCQPRRLENDKYVIILRITRSWNYPHAFRPRKGGWMFYTRRGAQNVPLDLADIRSSFLRSEGATEAVRNFRDARIAQIIAGETPAKPLIDRSCLVLHMIPLGFRDANVKLPTLEAWRRGYGPFQMHWPTHLQHRVNIDGLVVESLGTSGDGRTGVFGYTQLYRNGAIEAVNVGDFRPIAVTDHRVVHELDLLWIQRSVARSVRAYLTLQEECGTTLPVVTCATALGVEGATLREERAWETIGRELDRDTLALPDVLIEVFDTDVDAALRPIFDGIANGAGLERSPYYND